MPARLLPGCCAVALAAALIAPPALVAQQTANAGAAAAVGPEAVGLLRPGDVLRVTVWRYPEYSGELRVASDSTLVHPFFQALKVAGVPLPAVRELIRARLEERIREPDFVIEPLLRVSVAGEVRLPNLYTLPPETTVAQAIAQAGGPTEQARLSDVRLVREGRKTRLDLADPKAPLASFTIRSGDEIVVGRRSDLLRDVLGPIGSLLAATAAIVTVVRR